MKILRNFFVLLAAIVLCLFLFPIGILYTIIVAVLTENGNRPYVYVSESAFSIALSLDLLGNVVCKDLFNHTLIKPNAYAFGKNWETISSVLGKNKAANSLTHAGRALADLLNWLDKEHVENAAKFDLTKKTS